MIPVDLIDMTAHIFGSIDAFCAGLSEEQWKTPSQLPRWTVQDNLSHIIGTERKMLGMPETEHRSSDMSQVHNPIGEMNEHHVDLRRDWPGAKVLEEFRDISRRRVEQLRNAGEDYFATPEMTPTGPGTIGDFLHIRVMDIWVHEQDMRRAVGIMGNEGSPEAGHSLDRLIRTVPIVVGKRAATPEGATVVIRVTGPVQRTIVCTVKDGRAQTGGDIPPDALCDISMGSDVFLQLATGRGNAAELARRCSVIGDNDHATKVLTNFNMMI